MKRALTIALALVAVIAATLPTDGIAREAKVGQVPAACVPGVADPTGLIASPNIEALCNLPNPGVIGARFRDGVMYVTSVAGLTTYDVSDPASPTFLGALPLPHFENEDVDLGGDILLISNDAAESTGVLYVIDISDPANPALRAQLPMGGNPVLGGPGHTASCVLDCSFAWVTDAGGIMVVDLRNPDAPAILGTHETPAHGDIATHDVQVDSKGYVWVVGFGGTVGYKLPKDYDGSDLGKQVVQTSEEGFSTYIEEVGLGPGDNPNDFIHHNSFRPGRKGVVYVTEEDYTRPACQGAGSFQTWKLSVDRKGRPTGEEMTPLDQWETELMRDLTANALVCSAHYFDVDHNVVAQGWYEMGMRLLDVSNPRKIRQVGYFAPDSAMTWAAYFPPTDPSGTIVYVFDASHGIDVVRFDRPQRGKLSAPHQDCRNKRDCRRQRLPAMRAPVRDEWTTTAPLDGLQTKDFGYACRLTIPS